MNTKYFLYVTAAVFLLSLWVWPQISILILLVLLANDMSAALRCTMHGGKRRCRCIKSSEYAFWFRWFGAFGI